MIIYITSHVYKYPEPVMIGSYIHVYLTIKKGLGFQGVGALLHEAVASLEILREVKEP